MIKTSASGTQYQSVFCKAKEKEGRGKNAGQMFTNYIGYLTVGNKVLKVSVNPNLAVSNNGEEGYFVTFVATNLTPRSNNRRTGNGARF